MTALCQITGIVVTILARGNDISFIPLGFFDLDSGI